MSCFGTRIVSWVVATSMSVLGLNEAWKPALARKRYAPDFKNRNLITQYEMNT